MTPGLVAQHVTQTVEGWIRLRKSQTKRQMIRQLIHFLESLLPPDWSDGVYTTVSDDEWLLLIAEDEDYCSSGYGIHSVTIRYPF